MSTNSRLWYRPTRSHISSLSWAMAFPAAHDFEVSGAMFNDVRQNQYIYNIQGASLESALSTARIISSMVQQVENSREQLQVLGTSINTLLSTLDTEYSAGRLSKCNTSFALQNLNTYVDHLELVNPEQSSSPKLWSSYRLLDGIYEFVQKETTTEFLKSLPHSDDRVAKIAAYYRQLDASIASFQVQCTKFRFHRRLSHVSICRFHHFWMLLSGRSEVMLLDWRIKRLFITDWTSSNPSLKNCSVCLSDFSSAAPI